MRYVSPMQLKPSSIAIFFALLLFMPVHLNARPQSEKNKDNDKQSSEKQGVSRLRIELTGGDENKPIADASVYIKYKKVELNVKTNQEGVARSPDIPRGKILLQVVAPGWKTYGEWQQVTEDEQTIHIHLVRPTTRWY